jgi:hypothetical protein
MPAAFMRVASNHAVGQVLPACERRRWPGQVHASQIRRLPGATPGTMIRQSQGGHASHRNAVWGRMLVRGKIVEHVTAELMRSTIIHIGAGFKEMPFWQSRLA